MVLTNRALACRMRHTRLIDTAGNAAQPHAKLRLQVPHPIQGERCREDCQLQVDIYVQNQGLIEEHLEEWDHESNKMGFLGRIQEGRKKLDAKMFKTVPSDPDKKLRRDLSMVEGYDRMTVH
jgi:hypothetical protein